MAEYEPSPKHLMSLELPFLALLVLEPEYHDNPTHEREKASEDGYAFIDRLRYPQLNNQAERRVIAESKALFYSRGPIADLEEIKAQYPNRALTPLQMQEARKIKLVRYISS